MSEEHCSSYYAATANDTTTYPELEGQVNVDVCVIGAGFTGTSTALNLSERGFKVALIEANRVGWGASGRNGGQVGYAVSGEGNLRRGQKEAADKLIKEMNFLGHDIIKTRIEKYGIDCDFKAGNMAAACKQRQQDDLAEEYDHMSSLGYEDHFTLVDKSTIQDYIGSDRYVGGLYNNIDGHLHPLNLCKGEVRAAASLGALIFEQSPVTHIKHGKKPEVHTEKGHIVADKVVLAGNAYHRLEKRKLTGYVFPTGSYIIATEPLEDELAAELLGKDQSVFEVNEILDYYRLSADKRMLYGGKANYSGRDPASIKGAMLPDMLNTFPQLKDKHIDFEWGGMIGITINRTPHVGRINGNVYYSQGYSGHGLNATHILSEFVSDAVAGQMERYDIFAKAKQIRLPVPRWVGNQMVALGMLYYRMKDLF
ncbi:NAD(P)/FAD-dependent oxidoreductase [Pseudemcibacter aquimaris]|uniref:NAD(P)/FAD-dependent oxidoreductase n=1 Tax=Pseudemcibacter aquimaris TaxID=2857064 RepID=UPI0020125FA2|nr:FAD-binding oxidoreductase [Pseudemcibacter aquimaris]MCC3862107.1 FAD-binding oxidoreductase [Pseudemcibacter aquimaris]WDU58860.1 FAD-binding oxidoreductase [Pseudemcibacter aquimaris]